MSRARFSLRWALAAASLVALALPANAFAKGKFDPCLLYTSPSPRD